MKTVWRSAVRTELKARLATLEQDQPAAWGRMSAGRMVVHIADSFRSSIGELTIKPRYTPLRFFPLNTLAIYWIPMLKNLPTAPELLSRPLGVWAGDVAELMALIDKFATRDRTGSWPDHAAFGSMTGEDWGVLMYRHTDHHFRQFGI